MKTELKNALDILKNFSYVENELTIENACFHLGKCSYALNILNSLEKRAAEIMPGISIIQISGLKKLSEKGIILCNQLINAIKQGEKNANK